MDTVLMILEVSKKQDYIFSSKKLWENAARSMVISRVTGNAFFQEVAGKVYWEKENLIYAGNAMVDTSTAAHLYQEKENLIYAGGGHTVLQFPSMKQAQAFARLVTEAAMQKYDGLELFVKLLPCDKEKLSGESLKELSKQLERKKSLRREAFRPMSFGVEELDPVTFRPVRLKGTNLLEKEEVVPPPPGWIYPREFKELAGEDNFISVVHIDGNSMGKRVDGIYEQEKEASWEDLCKKLRDFSEGIQQDFEEAFSETVDELIAALPADRRSLPIRPIILAGDDVCFVTTGSFGLECARIFLEKLSKKTNDIDNQHYSACAGVAIVHQKYPFHLAYDLSEELCSNAKKYGASLDAAGGVSAIDWHIEFGQLKGGLSELREDYRTEDGNQLSLRPLTVLVPDGIQHVGGLHLTDNGAKPLTVLVPDGIQHEDVRTYDFFRHLCRKMKGEYGKVARSKIKELRTALKQGEVESRFFLHDKEIEELLWRPLEARYRDAASNIALLEENLAAGNRELDKNIFRCLSGEEKKRCLVFDAIEMIDHFTEIEEVPV